MLDRPLGRSLSSKSEGKCSVIKFPKYFGINLSIFGCNLSQRAETKTAVPRLTAGDFKTDKEKIKLVDHSQKVEELGFWDLIERAAKEILSPDETEKFITAVKKVRPFPYLFS